MAAFLTWQKNGLVSLALALPLCHIMTIAGYFFAPAPLRDERCLIAVIGICRLVPLIFGMRFDRLHVTALGILLPAYALFLAALTIMPSRSLAIYAFLLYWLGMALLMGGRDLLVRVAPILAGIGSLVFIPGVVFTPVVHGLLQVVIASTRVLCDQIFPDVAIGASDLMINGHSVRFIEGCSGYDFMMTYAATVMVLWRSGTGAKLFFAELAFAIGLAFTINLMRIVGMVGLARAGYWDLALGSGHAWLGGLCIFIGAMLLCNRAVKHRLLIAPRGNVMPLI